MTEILIVLAVILLLYATSGRKTVVKTDSCLKGHKWIYNNENTEEEYLVCSVCKRRPGAGLDDGSEL